MTRDEALRLLGLDTDATEADIKLAYRELAQILHPDKYVDNKRLADRATEQFKHVNEARELLLSAKGSSGRRGGRGTGSAQAGKSGGAGGGAKGAKGAGRGADTDAGSVDRATILRARLAGIAAARVQLTSQLDTELDRRRVGIYLAVGGVIATILGRAIRPLLAIAPVALVWGIVQIVSTFASINTIRQHLAELEKGRKKCEKELNAL
jgi:hypothetical protein